MSAFAVSAVVLKPVAVQTSHDAGKIFVIKAAHRIYAAQLTPQTLCVQKKKKRAVLKIWKTRTDVTPPLPHSGGS